MDGWHRAFILHSRPYRETSLLLDVFTEQAGRLSLIAKGARSARSRTRGYLQPFTPLMINYSGKGDIKTLRQVEPLSLALPLSGYSLYSAFYLNEILTRVLTKDTSYEPIFFDYLTALKALAISSSNIEVILRRFEFCLLAHLGYAIDFIHCAGSGDEISEQMSYQYYPEKGFIGSLIYNNLTFMGKHLKAFSSLDFKDSDDLKAAKRFTRIALKPYIGSQPLKSRELFQILSSSRKENT